MSIAWVQLKDEKRAQLLTIHPQLQFEHDLAMGMIPKCPRGCGNAIYLNDDGEIECWMCNRKFDEHGNEIKPTVGVGRALAGGYRR